MNQDKLYSRRMTPVRILDDDNGARVVFLESARFHVLARELPDFASLLESVRRAVENGDVVEVVTESIDSDLIKNIKPAN